MKDFLNREIDVDDSVIMIIPGFRNLVLGRVIRIGPKTVRVQYTAPFGYNKDEIFEVSRAPRDVVKVDGPDLTMYLLTK